MSELDVKRGTIVKFSGHIMSRLWTIHFEDGTQCYIESGFGMRQLVRALQDPIGKEIIYQCDPFNVMSAFIPVEQLTPEDIEQLPSDIELTL